MNIDYRKPLPNAGIDFFDTREAVDAIEPGAYAKLPSRTDWGGELAVEYPVSKSAVLFAHWEPMYSTKGGEGWGKGFQHHVGTGVTFSF